MMRRVLSAILLVLLVGAVPSAQQIQATTVRVTSTAVDALCVGGSGPSPASSACTGGIYAGAVALNGTLSGVSGTLTIGSVVSVSGFGTHVFSSGGTGGNNIGVRNTTAGTVNYAQVQVGNDAWNTLAALRAHSSTYTTSGFDVADGAVVVAVGVGGLSLAAAGVSGTIRYFTGGTSERGRMHASGGFSWGDTTDPGVTNFRVAGISSLVGGIAGLQRITPSISASQNDWAPTGHASATLFEIDASSAPGTVTITGLQGGVDGRLIILKSVNGGTVQTATESGSSSAANRFDAAPSMASGASSMWLYTGSRWHLISTS